MKMELLQGITLRAENDVATVRKTDAHSVAVVGNLAWCILVVKFNLISNERQLRESCAVDEDLR